MAKLVRKNLMVDAEKLRELARRRNKSESETVRDAVDTALFADEFMEIIRELHESDGIEDVFERLPSEQR
jgi:hypothetical protein